RLDALREEKEMASSKLGDFWNGSYLVEGVINKEGSSRDKLTLDVRLSPPDKRQAIDIQVSGTGTNLTVAINDLASRLLAAVRKGGASPEEWNPAAEAGQYFDEAKWLRKWNVFAEAKAASDASWALGLHTRAAAD